MCSYSHYCCVSLKVCCITNYIMQIKYSEATTGWCNTWAAYWYCIQVIFYVYVIKHYYKLMYCWRLYHPAQYQVVKPCPIFSSPGFLNVFPGWAKVKNNFGTQSIDWLHAQSATLLTLHDFEKYYGNKKEFFSPFQHFHPTKQQQHKQRFIF